MPRHNDPRLNDARRQRDEAFRRVSRVRRMTILGAGALTAAVAAGVSAAAPGRTVGAKETEGKSGGTTTSAPGHSRSPRLRMPALASPAQLGLQSSQPAQPAPQPAPQTTQPAPQPAPAAPQPAPAAPQPAPSSGGSGVVSGGS